MTIPSSRSGSWCKLILGAICGAILCSVSPWAAEDPKRSSATSNVIGEKFWPSEFGADDLTYHIFNGFFIHDGFAF